MMTDGHKTAIFNARQKLLRSLQNKLSKLDISSSLSEIKNYILNFPSERAILDTLYATMLNDVGKTSAARGIAKIIIDTDNKLHQYAKSYLNLEPIVNTTWMLSRFGEMIDQTAHISHQIKLGQIKKKPILPILDQSIICNKAFIPYLHDNFSILNPGEEANYFSRYSMISPTNTTFVKYSNNVYGHYSDAAPGIHQILSKEGLPHFAFSLKDETKQIAEGYLKSFGLSNNDTFVTLHLRESGFVDGNRHNWRNNELNDHVDAIKYLLNQGIKVVRIGHNKMQQAPSIDGLIDLTPHNRPPEVDIYVCGACLFYYGNPSGPYSMSYQFGVPMFFTNLFPYTHARPNTLNQIVPMIDIKSSKKLKLSELYERDISNVFAPEPYKRQGIEIGKISPDENISGVKEMLDKLSKLKNKPDESILDKTGLPNNIWITEQSKQLI